MVPTSIMFPRCVKVIYTSVTEMTAQGLRRWPIPDHAGFLAQYPSFTFVSLQETSVLWSLLGSHHTHTSVPSLVLVVAFRVFTLQETQDMNMSANTCTYIRTHVCMHTYRRICGLCRKTVVCWDRQKTSQQPPEQARV